MVSLEWCRSNCVGGTLGGGGGGTRISSPSRVHPGQSQSSVSWHEAPSLGNGLRIGSKGRLGRANAARGGATTNAAAAEAEALLWCKHCSCATEALAEALLWCKHCSCARQVRRWRRHCFGASTALVLPCAETALVPAHCEHPAIAAMAAEPLSDTATRVVPARAVVGCTVLL